MRYSITILFFIAIASSIHAQKIYVWCPENYQVKPRIGFKRGDTIKIAFFDGRTIPQKSKIECTSADVIQQIFSELKSAYPSATLLMQPESEYFQKTTDSKSIIIKIRIQAYNAGFGTDVTAAIGVVSGHLATMVIPKGQWNAVTSFYAEVLVGGKKTAKEISNLSSKSNLLGFKSAKNALSECYNLSMGELLFFIDDQLTNL